MAQIPDTTARQFPWPAVQLAHVFDASTQTWVPQAAIGPTQATVTLATVSTTSSVIAAANPARRRLVLHNDSGAVVFVTFGPVSTASVFSIRLASQDGYQGPLGDYTGVVSAIRASGTSPLLVTEILT